MVGPEPAVKYVFVLRWWAFTRSSVFKRLGTLARTLQPQYAPLLLSCALRYGIRQGLSSMPSPLSVNSVGQSFDDSLYIIQLKKSDSLKDMGCCRSSCLDLTFFPDVSTMLLCQVAAEPSCGQHTNGEDTSGGRGA